MGSGRWSPNTYKARATQRQATGRDAFHYSSGARSVHPTLDPHGLEVRESRDSDEHPDSNAIMVGLDVSGSMGLVVRGIHAALPKLLNLLLEREYVPHPQIMFSAFSNGSCSEVAVQVGQFESDNRMDENLENMIIGGRLAGGCDVRESAELMLYLAARHTSIDCWERRQRKGYLFLITDEMAYEHVKANEIKRIFGSGPDKDIPLQDIVAEAQQKYHLFVLIPTETQSGQNPKVHEHFRAYFDSRHVILLEEKEEVSQAIALSIGLNEGTVTLKEGLEHLRLNGAGGDSLKRMERTLRHLEVGAVQGKGGMTGQSGLGDRDDDDDDLPKRRRGIRRL